MRSVTLASITPGVGQLTLVSVLALLITLATTVNAQVSLTCPADVTVSNEPGICSAAVSFPGPIVSGTNGSDIVTITPPSGSTFPGGSNEVIVAVTSNGTNVATCSFFVIVNDTENPTITCPADITVSTDPGLCSASNVTYEATATDNCTNVTVVCDPASGSTFAGGTNLVTCTATDSSGNTTNCGFSVIVEDTEPPSINGLSLNKTRLWPPNHKLVNVTVRYNVTDNCDPAPESSMSVTSNEPDNGSGDGNTTGDWNVIDAHHIQLRAERSGSGAGRSYTITVTSTDTSSNSSVASVIIGVPHDNGKHKGNGGDDNVTGQGNGSGTGGDSNGTGQGNNSGTGSDGTGTGQGDTSGTGGDSTTDTGKDHGHGHGHGHGP